MAETMRIFPNTSGWVLTSPRAPLFATFPTREEAESFARSVARKHPDIEVTIIREDEFGNETHVEL